MKMRSSLKASISPNTRNNLKGQLGSRPHVTSTADVRAQRSVMTTTDDDRRLGRGQPADGRTRPASFGLDAPARNRVRKLRRQRNLALHGGFDQAGAQQPTQCLDRDD